MPEPFTSWYFDDQGVRLCPYGEERIGLRRSDRAHAGEASTKGGQRQCGITLPKSASTPVSKSLTVDTSARTSSVSEHIGGFKRPQQHRTACAHPRSHADGVRRGPAHRRIKSAGTSVGSYRIDGADYGFAGRLLKSDGESDRTVSTAVRPSDRNYSDGHPQRSVRTNDGSIVSFDTASSLAGRRRSKGRRGYYGDDRVTRWTVARQRPDRRSFDGLRCINTVWQPHQRTAGLWCGHTMFARSMGCHDLRRS